MPADDNTTISFRLPAKLHDEMVRLADASGTTKHQLARTLIAQALNAGGSTSAAPLDVEQLEEAFQEIRNAISDLRLAVGRGFGAVLQDVSPKRDRQDIRRWVFDRIITATPQAGRESDGSQ